MANGVKGEAGAEGVEQKAVSGGGAAAAAAVVRADGKLTATQKRRLREKNRKARHTGGTTSDNAVAETNGTANAQPQSNKRAKRGK